LLCPQSSAATNLAGGAVWVKLIYLKLFLENMLNILFLLCYDPHNQATEVRRALEIPTIRTDYPRRTTRKTVPRVSTHRSGAQRGPSSKNDLQERSQEGQYRSDPYGDCSSGTQNSVNKGA